MPAENIYCHYTLLSFFLSVLISNHWDVIKPIIMAIFKFAFKSVFAILKSTFKLAFPSPPEPLELELLKVIRIKPYVPEPMDIDDPAGLMDAGDPMDIDDPAELHPPILRKNGSARGPVKSVGWVDVSYIDEPFREPRPLETCADCIPGDFYDRTSVPQNQESVPKAAVRAYACTDEAIRNTVWNLHMTPIWAKIIGLNRYGPEALARGHDFYAGVVGRRKVPTTRSTLDTWSSFSVQHLKEGFSREGSGVDADTWSREGSVHIGGIVRESGNTARRWMVAGLLLKKSLLWGPVGSPVVEARPKISTTISIHDWTCGDGSLKLGVDGLVGWWCASLRVLSVSRLLIIIFAPHLSIFDMSSASLAYAD
ncbi:hypothetical protein M501DRAFT_988815 [Patellaria atrata CBS 101060]|uniref:Uncharacterized protein n=1 Tax=Patellaria atrata CBS 101060 TaxID=1346257 RepID=A0A9P4S5P7_9PEZI|nr:hypothetical protein M501DRAFT_988815 [Patellaria atrata CBS 101060]